MQGESGPLQQSIPQPDRAQLGGEDASLDDRIPLWDEQRATRD